MHADALSVYRRGAPAGGAVLRGGAVRSDGHIFPHLHSDAEHNGKTHKAVPRTGKTVQGKSQKEEKEKGEKEEVETEVEDSGMEKDPNLNLMKMIFLLLNKRKIKYPLIWMNPL